MDAVKHEENPKFKNSQFMSLMRQLRDGEMTVEGNEMVPATEATSASRIVTDSWSSTISAGTSSVHAPLATGHLADIKGKGRAMDVDNNQETSYAGYAREFLAQQEAREAANQRQLEDENDAYFAQENADYMSYWDSMERVANAVRSGTTAQSDEWSFMQRDWDQWDATASGISRVANYQFQANNPYLLGDASRTRHHEMHTGGMQMLLQVKWTSVLPKVMH